MTSQRDRAAVKPHTSPAPVAPASDASVKADHDKPEKVEQPPSPSDNDIKGGKDQASASPSRGDEKADATAQDSNRKGSSFYFQVLTG